MATRGLDLEGERGLKCSMRFAARSGSSTLAGRGSERDWLGDEAWRRGIERALAGHGGVDEPARPAAEPPCPPRERGPARDAFASGETLGAAPSVRSAGVQSDRDTRVWHLYKPYLLPVLCIAVVGVVLAVAISAVSRWLLPPMLGPPSGAVFEAEWDAHRRGLDIAAPEVLKELEEEPTSQESAPTAPIEPHGPDSGR